jgi:hypothetical protein
MSIQQLLSLIQEEENRNPPLDLEDIMDKVFSTSESHGWCEDIDPDTSAAMGMLMVAKAHHWMITEEDGNTLDTESSRKVDAGYELLNEGLVMLVAEYKARRDKDDS